MKESVAHRAAAKAQAGRSSNPTLASGTSLRGRGRAVVSPCQLNVRSIDWCLALRITCGLWLCGSLSGCNHSPGTAMLPTGGPSAFSGTSSVKFVNRESPEGPTALSKIKITTGTTGLVQAVPVEPLALPQYPVEALAAHLGTITKTVTINIGKDGNVLSVSSSMMGFSTPTEFDSEFDKAIEAAVQKWEFNPAWSVPLEPGKDGTPIVGDPVPTESSLDAVFTFSSSGVVTSGVRR
jgi:hypothetical protein